MATIVPRKGAAALVILIALAGARLAAALEGVVLALDVPKPFDQGNVILVDAATGSKTTLAQGQCFGPCFSPDGKQIAFWKDSKIYVMDNDGTDVREICGTSSFSQQCMSWASTGHIYWTRKDYHWYRVSPSTKRTEIAATFSNVKPNGGKVSLDGRRGAASSYPDGGSIHVYRYDLTNGTTKDFGSGCQGTISPDGTLVTHNLSSHRECSIHHYSDGSEYKRITCPTGEFNRHRFSHSSNDYVVWSREDVSPPDGYVTYIHTNTSYKIGKCAPYDFWKGTLPSPGSPNTPPTASISAPADGAGFIAGDALLYSGSGSDAEDGSLSGGSLSWEIDRSGDGTGPVHTSTGSSGSYTFPAELTVETTYTITLTATDSGGATSSDTHTVTVSPAPQNDPPAVSVTQPAVGAQFDEPADVYVEASASDSDGTVTEVELYLDGRFIRSENHAPYQWSDLTGLAAGTYTVKVVAYDDDGATADDSVSITVKAAGNQPPAASITQPSNNASFTAGDALLYAGSGSDAEDGALSGGSLSWEIDRSGDGTGPVHTSRGGTGSYTFPAELTAETTYTITLTATDSGGATGSDTRTVTVSPIAPPELIWLEAEWAGDLGQPMGVGADADASNGQYVEVAPGSDGRGSVPSDGRAAYVFDVAQGGTYVVWGRVIAPTAGDDSFWVRMDGGTWIQWNNIALGGNWHWDDVHDTDDGGRVVQFDLSAGAHTLEIAYREDGTRLDKILVTNSPAYVPDGEGGPAVNGGGTQGDSESPAVTITVPSNGGAVYGTVLVEGSASDNVAVDAVEVSVDGAAYAAATGTADWGVWTYTFDASSLAEGEHTIAARATDTSGNTAETSVAVLVDPSASREPSITITGPTPGDVWYVGTTPAIQWTAANLECVTVTYSTDGGSTFGMIESSVAVDEAEWGRYPWTVPDEPSVECQICISGYLGECPTSSGSFEIRAVTDADSDGMDDGWEIEHFGDLAHDDTTDADGDGLTDYVEFTKGTDPLSGDSALGSAGFGCHVCRQTPGAARCAAATLLFAALVLLTRISHHAGEKCGLGT